MSETRAASASGPRRPVRSGADVESLIERVSRTEEVSRDDQKALFPGADVDETDERATDEEDKVFARGEPDTQSRREIADVRALEQRYRDRERYTHRLFWLMVLWMAVVLLIVLACGVRQPDFRVPTIPATVFDFLMLLVVAAGVSLVVRDVERRMAVARIIDCFRQVMITSSAGAAPAPGRVRPWLGLLGVGTLVAIVYFMVRARAVSAAASVATWLVAFDLPDPVILALIGSTTANVIGLFVIVVRYLFAEREGR